MISQFELAPSEGSKNPKGLSRLLDTWLPLNRKEAFFTATVLPAIICADNFKHFDGFLELLNLTDVQVDVSPEGANIQFFTEYCLMESIFGDSAEARFANPPHTKERPDLVIFIERTEPLLVVIEAKLYASTHGADLNKQMADQEEHVVNYLRKHWPGLQTAHVALLPKLMKSEIGSTVNRPIITWEDVLETYKDVSSAQYFREILSIALNDYESLRAESTPANGDDELTGGEIWRTHQNGTLTFQTMGRQGGLRGDLLKDDIAKDRWQEQHYYVRTSSLPHNSNWFLISEFADLVSRKSVAAMFNQVLASARDRETDDAALGRLVRQLLMKEGGVDLFAA